ncbi:hypothetical protein [Streptomyces sp. NPDC005805]|uniref:hypothetical protein n=1 Tax=Streptomyces sp. NPDC005805 TaxID=3157068 RepID=UPI0033F12188
MKRKIIRACAAAAASLCIAFSTSPVASAKEKLESQGMVPVDSPLSYEYNYTIGFSPFYTPQMIMNGADAHFKDTFPFPSNCAPFNDLPPVHSPTYSCDLYFLGTTNPVAIVNRTPTSFTFKSLPGHSEGAGRYIRFTFSSGSMWTHQMKVEGWGPWTLAAATSIQTGAVNGFWTTYAKNLNQWINGGKL